MCMASLFVKRNEQWTHECETKVSESGIRASKLGLPIGAIATISLIPATPPIFASSDLDLQLGHRRKIRPGSWTHRHAACSSAAAGTGARASRRRMSSRLCMPCDRSPMRSDYQRCGNCKCNPAVPSTQGGRIVSIPPAIHLAEKLNTSWKKKPPAGTTRSFVPKFWSGRAGGGEGVQCKWKSRKADGASRVFMEITALPRGSC